MDIQQSPDYVDIGELERDLQAALRVDPSPEFLARVRSQLANERTRSRWNQWSLVAISAAAVILAGIAVRHQGPSRPPVGESQSTVTVQDPVARDLTKTFPMAAGQVSGPPQPSSRVELPTNPSDHPPVFRAVANTRGEKVAVNSSIAEARAIRALLTAVGAGTIAVVPVIATDQSNEQIHDLVVPPITFQPVTIEPLHPMP